MWRRSVVGSIVCIGCLAACKALVEAVASPPNRDASAIVLQEVPDSIFAGDSAVVYAQVNDKDGRPAWNDTVVVWQSSNTDVVWFDASRPPIPTPHGFAWLRAKSPGEVTVTAHTNKVTSSKTVKVMKVLGPNDIAVDDRRLGYALANQSTVAGPYTPDVPFFFNSSGGGVTITRDSTGWYNVRFAGLGRKPGHRDNVQVTAYGSPPGTHCKLLSWVTEGTDMIVPVHCHLGGAAVDSRFTVLLSGARVYDLSTPFAFAERLPQTQNLALDTSATAFNSVSGHIAFGRTGVGSYNFGFPGFESFSGPATFLATSINQTADHCRIFNYVLNGGIVAACFASDGTQTDGRVTIMEFTRGRVGHRFGYASTQNLVSATPSIDPTLTFNSAGGTVSSRRLGVGQWTVTFAGLGRASGATEIVIVSALKETDHICSVVSWGNTGTADLTVTLQCFDAAGTRVDARFDVLVIE